MAIEINTDKSILAPYEKELKTCRDEIAEKAQRIKEKREKRKKKTKNKKDKDENPELIKVA